MSKTSDGVREEGGVCARCGGLVFDPVIPQKKQEWVGLTKEEKQEWIDAMPYDIEPRHCMILINVTEVKLKQKNSL